jgi:hypothetical protein
VPPLTFALPTGTAIHATGSARFHGDSPKALGQAADGVSLRALADALERLTEKLARRVGLVVKGQYGGSTRVGPSSRPGKACRPPV